ncbi:hypothetical protein BDN72DRAFT_903344 [Pluteus cervinus]|uniref:Uncharacterized protein n=1 Tax=Pluteus cervinus TaxID=181527 RepID=A0ACD3A9E2_9AGAR|nr:hypothetical protein BDN72DRAFT_903344 [Pluteus cervinus]
MAPPRLPRRSSPSRFTPYPSRPARQTGIAPPAASTLSSQPDKNDSPPSPHPRSSRSGLNRIYPLPECLERASSEAEISHILNEWQEHNFLHAPFYSHTTIRSLATQIKANLLAVLAVKTQIKERERLLRDIRPYLSCDTCGWTCHDPYTLSCRHMSCGSCLRGCFRSQLLAKLKRPAFPDGTTMLAYLAKLKTLSSKRGFALALDIIRFHKFTDVTALLTYKAPCCEAEIQKPPRRVLTLTDLCNGEASQATSNDYFDALFEDRPAANS